MDNQYQSVHPGFSFLEFLEQIFPEKRSLDMESSTLDVCYQEYKKALFFDLNQEKISIEREFQLSEKNAYAFSALVLKNSTDGLIVGFVNPLNQENISAVSSLLNAYIKPVIVKQKDFTRIARLIYRKIEAIQNCANKIILQPSIVENVELFDNHDSDEISILAHLIIQDAVDIEASDIHIEVSRVEVNIRLRVDGVLQKYALSNQNIGDHLVRYFKLLAEVDITQDQRPSEGKKIAIMLGQEELNFRMSFMPTYEGQSVVIRLLGKAESYRLEKKIRRSAYLDEIQEYLSRSYGMFLISGPTGSGKTTTLYSALQEINTDTHNIITLEDPVEAKMPGINQIQVNELLNYSFVDALRAALRQDPDVIMIGEVRDEMTANMAVRAAITGHLVLSTVHARGVAEIPLRLLNLNVDSYLLAAALRLTASQRLVRKICPNCKEIAVLTDIEKRFLEKQRAMLASIASKEIVFYIGKGCYYCQKTGVSQREAIFEVLHMSSTMTSLLAQNKIADYMELVKTEIQGKTILDNAFSLAIAGDISLGEVIRMEND